MAVPIRADLKFGPGFLGASVAVYFATRSQADQFVAAYAKPVVGTGRVTTYCLD